MSFFSSFESPAGALDSVFSKVANDSQRHLVCWAKEKKNHFLTAASPVENSLLENRNFRDCSFEFILRGLTVCALTFSILCLLKEWYKTFLLTSCKSNWSFGLHFVNLRWISFVERQWIFSWQRKELYNQAVLSQLTCKGWLLSKQRPGGIFMWASIFNIEQIPFYCKCLQNYFKIVYKF